ncbi:MAG: YihY/virulence factor BrkB family protein [Vicinamibacterales bacterium]
MLAYLRVPIGWGDVLKRTAKESLADDIMSLSAQLAYYFFLSLFPALLFLVALASFFPVANFMDEAVRYLGRVAPPDIASFFLEQIRKISESDDGGILTFAFLFTIWSSSGAMVSIISTMNTAYDIEESRPWWKTRLIALGLTVGLALFTLISFALVIAGPTFGERLAEMLRLGPAFVRTWNILQWPVVFTLVVTAIGIIYYCAPDADQDWVWITPGAVLATLLWLVISLGFKVYLANWGNYNETYGALAGVIILLLWFYLSGLAILAGAEMNAEIEHASPYGKAPGEKVPGTKKKIGVRAMREFEARLRAGQPSVAARAATAGGHEPNCDVERGTRRPDLKPSDLLIGAIALLPPVIGLARTLGRSRRRRA